ncbi:MULTISPECIES: restriction endonuclease subunit S [Aerosakkonema]|uniref:restriction endonuclease subunit S n=1 Tax=Aerosakkonema TaxID=1246629 RepID=UPI0035B796B6
MKAKYWPIVRLDDIKAQKKYALNCGPFGSKLVSRDYIADGVPVIRGTNLTGDSCFSFDNFVFVSEEKANELMPNNAHPGDLIFTQRGTLGQVGIIPKNCSYKRFVVSQSQMKLTVDEAKAVPYFLYCYFRTPSTIKTIHNLAISSGVPHINLDILRNFQVLLPRLAIQRKIAAILSAYDDLIENNTRRIKILEEMARSLYREWFVNFRFPGHQQVKMIDSELGLIPEGWEFKKLTELGLLKRGKSKHRPRNDPSLYGGKYPFIQTGEVKSALLYITNYEQTYNEKGLAQSKLWEPRTLLITIAANIAETAIITMSACFPDSIVGFVADFNQVTPELIKYQIDELKQKMQNFSRGTAQDNLSLDKLEVFDFLVPAKNIFDLFNQHTEPLFLQIKNLTIKNNNLRHTRDLLLPKLISGEIDVENLDINTGEIAA